MNELISLHEVDFEGEIRQTVDARELHAFLENGDKFAGWIKDRIAQYGFAEGRDYIVFRETPNNPAGGRPSTEYYLTLDMAKELAMVERNEKGRQARQYFIECEKRLRQMTKPIKSTEDMIIALAQAATMQAESVKTLKAEVQNLRQKQDWQDQRLEDVRRGLVDVNMPLRAQFNKAVRDLAIRKGKPFDQAYDEVYEILSAQEHIDIKRRAENRGVKPIDVVEQSDLLVKATRLAKAL